jgi:ribosomal protein L16 Arg81 hydroxylase
MGDFREHRKFKSTNKAKFKTKEVKEMDKAIETDIREMKALLQQGVIGEEQEQLFKRLDRAIVSLVELVKPIERGDDNSVTDLLTEKRQDLVESSWIIDVAEHYHRPMEEAKVNQLKVMGGIMLDLEGLLEFYKWVTIASTVRGEKPFKRTLRELFECWKKG